MHVQVYNVLTQVMPYAFNAASKIWEAFSREPSLLPPVDSKGRIYQERYEMLYHRLFLNLNENLQPSLVPEAKAVQGIFPGQRALTTVASLVGNPGRKLTFGLLRRLDDELQGRWVIEDLHKVMPVELVVQSSGHFVTDASFILAEGEVKNGIFRIDGLLQVEAITRKASLSEEVPRQIFGGNLTDDQLKKLEKHYEPAYPDGMFVVLSEVHLDSAQVLDDLEVVFQGYEEAGPPSAYIFMGSFSSRAFVPTAEGVRSYREGFERLKFMMRRLEAHVTHGTSFVFVPGPKDPGAQTLPRAPLPHYLMSDLAKEIPGVGLRFMPAMQRKLRCWVDVRWHAPILLPVEWGIWVSRYCIIEPASASLHADLMIHFYKKEPGPSQTPVAMQLFTSVEIEPSPCLVALRLGRKEVAWLRLPTQYALDALKTLLREARAFRCAMPKGRLEACREQLLSEKETELTQREARLCERERAFAKKEQVHTPSAVASSEDEEEVPFGSSVVMDWPLSRSEKQLRLVTVLERERIAAVACERNRAKRRFSEPTRSESGAAARCEVRVAPRVRGTNPCRVRHYSREMVFFRHDVLRLLRRHEAVPLTSSESQVQGFDNLRYTQAARFILDQAHLVPLPLEESNILWEYDHTLRLYPLPHAVFIGGSTPPFECSYKECKFTSVGLFSAATFYAYHPVKDDLQICDVPDRAG
ncbi:DPB2 [Symbiodinium necroappetens]|uniref:DNA polymerase II subunit 2 n=1 Tax=Symbiodinium necroappetens TaxID=1628268 RepID=A0A813CCH0_9DINO|nr:DPB2 [Symbiodinium necroappetens]